MGSKCKSMETSGGDAKRSAAAFVRSIRNNIGSSSAKVIDKHNIDIAAVLGFTGIDCKRALVTSMAHVLGQQVKDFLSDANITADNKLQFLEDFFPTFESLASKEANGEDAARMDVLELVLMNSQDVLVPEKYVDVLFGRGKLPPYKLFTYSARQPSVWKRHVSDCLSLLPTLGAEKVFRLLLPFDPSSPDRTGNELEEMYINNPCLNLYLSHEIYSMYLVSMVDVVGELLKMVYDKGQSMYLSFMDAAAVAALPGSLSNHGGIELDGKNTAMMQYFTEESALEALKKYSVINVIALPPRPRVLEYLKEIFGEGDVDKEILAMFEGEEVDEV